MYRAKFIYRLSHMRHCALALMVSWLAANATGSELRAVLLTTKQVNDSQLDRAKNWNANAIVLMLDESTAPVDVQTSANQIHALGYSLYYWIEVARCPQLADKHPEWMASLQGHDEWRRLHPQAPAATDGTVMKVYPWVPIAYRESFAAQKERVCRLLAETPRAQAVFLNDLQGAPSACGCGNIVCRWTTDYGPVRTATSLGPESAADFVDAIARSLPGTEIIPVWTPECEAHDGDADGQCAGVGCYEGTCWRAYAAQLSPLAARSKQIGALLLVRQFGQDTAHYSSPAGWIAHAIPHAFRDMPRKHDATEIATKRIIAVLQGWGEADDFVRAQIDHAVEANVGGYVVALAEIDQSWQPQPLPLPATPAP